MTDADFFRRLAAERASRLPRSQSVLDAQSQIAVRMIQLGGISTLFENVAAAQQTEVLIEIAAICERAAVDVTIPSERGAARKAGAKAAAAVIRLFKKSPAEMTDSEWDEIDARTRAKKKGRK